ncbi:Mg-dependent DNase [Mrakia frigida]|uniref:3'-5'-exodeoxyribonuclease n=1 Tax=Mrakia frigida TaxID=29902 RepID=UPI003FCC22BD
MRMTLPLPPHKFIDIAFNATDSMFKGVYHGKPRHPDDLHDVLLRSKAAGVSTCILTGGSLSESQEALELAEKHGVYSTVGLHPTRSNEMEEDPVGYLAALDALISKGKKGGKGKGRVVAIGECGLDYDRLHFCPSSIQKTHFLSQLSLARTHSLPLFLHSRAAHRDFIDILRSRSEDWKARGGVVHSFTGTKEEMEEILELDRSLFVGINGCSLKTEEGLEMVRGIPLERLMLETDSPYCTPTTSHASHAHLITLPPTLAALYSPTSSNKPDKFKAGEAVKGRMEPSGIGRVAWVVAKVKGVEMEVVVKAVWENTVRMFGLEEEEEEEVSDV